MRRRRRCGCALACWCFDRFGRGDHHAQHAEMLTAARERRQKALDLSHSRARNKFEGVSASGAGAVEHNSRATVSLSVAASMLAKRRLGQETARMAKSIGDQAGASKDAEISATRDAGDTSPVVNADIAAGAESTPPAQCSQQTTSHSTEPPAEPGSEPGMQTLPVLTIPDVDLEPEPELQPHHSPMRTQHIHSEELQQQTELLRQQLTIAVAAQRRDRTAVDQASAELERSKAALVDAEMNQQRLANHAREHVEAARVAAAREAECREELAELRRELTQSKAAEDGAATALTQVELNRVTAALVATEAQLIEARREWREKTEYSAGGRLRRAVDRAQRSEAEVEYLRRELIDVQNAREQDKSAAAAAQTELQRHRSAMTQMQKRLEDATRQRESEQSLHAKELENVRTSQEASEHRRRKAEAALGACKKRLSAVEAACRRQQLAAPVDKYEDEAVEQRQLAFSKRLDAVVAELGEVEALCEHENLQHVQDLKREKEAAQIHMEDGKRLRGYIEEREVEVRGLRVQLQEAQDEKAALERELAAVTGARDEAVTEAEAVWMRAENQIREHSEKCEADVRGLSAQLQEAQDEKVALEGELAAMAGARDAAVAETEAVQMRAEMQVAAANHVAAIWQRQMASKTVMTRGAGATASWRDHPHIQLQEGENRLRACLRPAHNARDLKQADPRAALRWAQIRMSLTRLEGETQDRQGHLAYSTAESTPGSPRRESLLKEGNSSVGGLVDRSVAVTPVREPTETAVQKSPSCK